MDRSQRILHLVWRSDIYSFGLVLAEASLGRPLDMGGSQAEVLDKRRVVPNLAGIDPRLRPLLEIMLQPEPSLRPSSMEEVATWTPRDEVTRALPDPEPMPPPRSEPVAVMPAPQAAPVKPVVQRIEPRRRSVEHWIIGGALAFVLLGGGGVAVYEMEFAQRERHQIVVPQPPVPEPPLPQPPTPQPPEPPPEPQPPPPSPLPQPLAARATAFVKAYGSGSCFLAVPAKITETAAAIDGFAKDKSAFDDFDKAFTTTIGFAPEIVGNRIWSRQCPALDLLRQADLDADASPSLFLKSTKVGRGQTLTGDLRASPGQVVTLLQVQEDGTVVDRSDKLRNDGGARTFDIPVQHDAGAGPFPQLLVAIASGKPLETWKSDGARTVDHVVQAMLDEAKGRGEKLGANAKLFLVTQ